MTRLAIMLAALAVIATACTPEQLDTLGITDPAARDILLALDDTAIRLKDGSTLELDGAITPAPPTTTHTHAPTSGYVHPWPNVQRWYATAIDAGFRPDEWRQVSCLIRRESGGNPNAYNGRDPAGGSRGLMQINGVHVRWLRNAGILTYADDLYNPWTNLRAARELQRKSGWGPWGGWCG